MQRLGASDPVSPVFLLIILAGLALRAAGIFHDPWPAEIQLSENIHVFRLLALLGGALGLIVALLIGLRRGRFEALFFVLLISCSYLAVQYSSEQLAWLMLGALLSLDAFERYLGAARRRWAALFWLGTILGTLSHTTFIYFYAALLIWHCSAVASGPGHAGALRQLPAFANYRDKGMSRNRHLWLRRDTLRSVVLLHIVPFAAVAAIHGLELGFGPSQGQASVSYFDTVINTFSLAFGAPKLSPFRPELAAFVMALVAAILYLALTELMLLMQAKEPQWLFFLVMLVAVPALMPVIHGMTAARAPFLLLSVLCVYLLLSSFIARLFRVSPLGKVLALGLAALFIVGNALYLVPFVKFGRGQYRAAVKFMAAAGRASPAAVTSDSDAENERLIEHYAARESAAGGVVYVKQADAPALAPEWYIVSSGDPYFSPPSWQNAGRGLSYRLVRRYPHGAESGCSWFVYRRTGSLER